jgi:sugar phosphate isomerase/epimerase
MFKIGFRSYINRHDLDIAKRIGMKVLEVMYEDNTRARQDEVADLLMQYDIKPSALLIYPQRDLEQLKADVDFAVRIGCPAYVGHPDSLTFIDKDKIGTFKKMWSEGVRYGEDKGVKVGVHSCGLGPESWDIMLNEVPGLYLKYDPSFSHQAGRNVPEEILKYGKRFNHFHAKDEIGYGRVTDFSRGIVRFRYAPAGMGEINWGSVVALLYEVGYQGDIAIEVHSEYWFSDEAFERGLIIAKRHLEQFMA